MKKINFLNKKTFLFFGTGMIVTIFAILAINFYIGQNSDSYIFQNINDLPETEVVLVLGAKVYDRGVMSDMFQDRVETAFDLYQNGKAKKILISGDHGEKDYDEVNTAKDYLLKKGVESENIFLDHAGFDTYDSLYRAKEIFEISSVTISTQNFHLPRAVYIGKSLGIETYGFSADRNLYAKISYNKVREIFSKVKAFLNVNFHSKPKFLGEKIPISGDSKNSWDNQDDYEILENKNQKDDIISEDSSEEIQKENNIPVSKDENENLLPNIADIKDDSNDKETTEEKNVLFDVPFSSQAPYGNWDDPRKQDGCEEVAAIMAMAWVDGKKLDSKYVDSEIDKISAYEVEAIGTFHDASASDVSEVIFRGYFKYDNIEVRYDIDKEDIKKELFRGNLILVPTHGQLLYNPNYTPPGPATHYLVVMGYDFSTSEFITNDPGTRNGEKYRYDEDVLENALLDYPTGFHEKIEEIKTAMIVVKK